MDDFGKLVVGERCEAGRRTSSALEELAATIREEMLAELNLRNVDNGH
jgi:hypothetical protein